MSEMSTTDLLADLRDLASRHGDTRDNPFLRAAIEKITRLNRELAEEQAALDIMTGYRESADEMNAKLQRELAEARRDAERYRWLRQDTSDWWASGICEQLGSMGDIAGRLTNDHLDAAIDAAMAKERGK